MTFTYKEMGEGLVNVLYLVDIAWLGSRSLVGIAHTYAEAEFVTFAKAEYRKYLCAVLCIVDEANRATEADCAYAK
jgi:hypothetical protein